MPINPEFIRVSIGTASCLGLNDMKLDAIPTTAYLMLFHQGKCIANCAFCSQARESTSKSDRLSRIQWPKFDLLNVLAQFKNLKTSLPFKRICIQVINYPNFFYDLLYIVQEVRKITSLPISISCQPLKKDQIIKLYNLGVDRMGVPFDAATPDLFYKIKGKGNKSPYKWEKHQKYIENLKEIFGTKNITTHLIVGMGETEKDAVKFIQNFKNLGINTGIFAFTPLKGTKMEKEVPPTIPHYRRIQLARFIIIYEYGKITNMKFDNHDRIIDFGIDNDKLHHIIQSGIPFQTTGCPNCNRPFYNERPGKKLYNYPKILSSKEIDEIFKDIWDYS
ncbi:MAG: radical SAM protein [Candidatus Helarchaeota archaeon]